MRRTMTLAARVAPAMLGAVSAACTLLLGVNDATLDAGAATDASGDTGAEAGGDATSTEGGPWCASLTPKPVFCEDWDENPLGYGWEAIEVGPDAGAAVALNTQFAQSAPYSMLVTVGPISPQDLQARINHTFNGSFTQLRVAFDVRFGAADGGGYTTTHLLELDLGGAPTDSGTPGTVIYVDLGQQNYVMDQYNDPDGATVNNPQAFSTALFVGWHHVEILLDVSHKSYEFKFDGADKLNGVMLRSPYFAGPVSTLHLRLGVNHLATNGGPIEMRFDNVVFDGQ